MGVTDHVIAATQRAVSTIGVIPTWIGSIGNRLGGWQQALRRWQDPKSKSFSFIL